MARIRWSSDVAFPIKSFSRRWFFLVGFLEYQVGAL